MGISFKLNSTEMNGMFDHVFEIYFKNYFKVKNKK